MVARTKTVHQPQNLGGDAKIEEWLDGLKVTYEFIPKAPVASFDEKKSLRNQARFVPLDEKRVEAYAEAMRNGSEFPPTISYGPRNAMVKADGNHRLQAKLKAKQKYMGTYLLAKDTPAETITLIMHQANAEHGLPTTEEERVAAALYLIDNGSNARNAAAALSIPYKLVVAASAKRAMDQRFHDCGVAPLIVEKLGEGVKRRLANIATDEGFVAAVELCSKANLNATETSKLVNDVNTARSSARQVSIVKTWTEDYAERIAAGGGGQFTRTPRGPKGRVGMAVGAIMGLPDDLDEVAKLYQGAEREAAMKKARLAARRLNEFARALAS